MLSSMITSDFSLLRGHEFLLKAQYFQAQEQLLFPLSHPLIPCALS